MMRGSFRGRFEAARRRPLEVGRGEHQPAAIRSSIAQAEGRKIIRLLESGGKQIERVDAEDAAERET